jgi:hypothetical protein
VLKALRELQEFKAHRVQQVFKAQQVLKEHKV